MKKVYPSYKIRSRKIEVCNLLRIRNSASATQDCGIFIELKTVPLKTVPLTDHLMQTEVLKSARDFGTKDFVLLKDKGLALATSDELKKLTELFIIIGR